MKFRALSIRSFGKISGKLAWRKYCSFPKRWMSQPAPQTSGS